MSLQTVLEGISREHRLPFLRKAFRPERQDVAEALIGELEPKLRNGSDFYRKEERSEFNEVVGTLIRQAEESGDTDRANALRFQQITSHFYADDIGTAAKNTGSPELVERTIEHYRGQYFNKAEMVINLLEHLGRKDEAREYSLEAAEALRRTNGGITASKIYLGFGMNQEAVEVRLDNKRFDEVIKLAQEHLGEEELPQLYQRVFDAAEGEGYDNGFPVKVRIAKLIGDEELERTTKKKYVDFVMAKGKAGYLGLIREAGTEQQLRDMHERIVAFNQQDGFYGCTCGWIRIEPKSLAEAAEEAYQDTQQVKYADFAMKTYEEIGDLPKALEFARVADPKKAEVLEKAVSLIAE
jgi:hypothetical protein